MLPNRKTKLGTIILVLFYFSATDGFLDTTAGRPQTCDQNRREIRDTRLSKGSQFRHDRVRSFDDRRRVSDEGGFREIRENLDRNNNVIDRRGVDRQRTTRSINERVEQTRRQVNDVKNDRKFDQFSRNNRQDLSVTERNSLRQNSFERRGLDDASRNRLHQERKGERDFNIRTQMNDRRISERISKDNRQQDLSRNRSTAERRSFETSSRTENRRQNIDQQKSSRVTEKDVQSNKKSTPNRYSQERRRESDINIRSQMNDRHISERISRDNRQQIPSRNRFSEDRRSFETSSCSENRKQHTDRQRSIRVTEEDGPKIMQSNERSLRNKERNFRFSDRAPRSLQNFEVDRRINPQSLSEGNRRIEYHNVRRKLQSFDENNSQRIDSRRSQTTERVRVVERRERRTQNPQSYQRFSLSRTESARVPAENRDVGENRRITDPTIRSSNIRRTRPEVNNYDSYERNSFDNRRAKIVPSPERASYRRTDRTERNSKLSERINNFYRTLISQEERRYRQNVFQTSHSFSRRQQIRTEERINPTVQTEARRLSSAVDRATIAKKNQESRTIMMRTEHRINPVSRTEFRRLSSHVITDRITMENKPLRSRMSRTEHRINPTARSESRRISSDVNRAAIKESELLQKNMNRIEQRITPTSIIESRRLSSPVNRVPIVKKNESKMTRIERNIIPTAKTTSRRVASAVNRVPVFKKNDRSQSKMRRTEQRINPTTITKARRSSSDVNRVKIYKKEQTPNRRTTTERNIDPTTRTESRRTFSLPSQIRVERRVDPTTRIESRRSSPAVNRVRIVMKNEPRVIDNNHIRNERRKAASFQERIRIAGIAIKSFDRNAKRFEIRTSRTRNSPEGRIVETRDLTERMTTKGLKNINSRTFVHNLLQDKVVSSYESIAWLNLAKVVLFSISLAQIIYNSNPKKFRLSNLMPGNKQKVC